MASSSSPSCHKTSISALPQRLPFPSHFTTRNTLVHLSVASSGSNPVGSVKSVVGRTKLLRGQMIYEIQKNIILLNASEIHGDVDLGERMGKILLEFQPDQTSRGPNDLIEDYIALSNVYASSGKWDEVQRVRKEMKIKRIETRPGASFI